MSRTAVIRFETISRQELWRWAISYGALRGLSEFSGSICHLKIFLLLESVKVHDELHGRSTMSTKPRFPQPFHVIHMFPHFSVSKYITDHNSAAASFEGHDTLDLLRHEKLKELLVSLHIALCLSVSIVVPHSRHQVVEVT